MTNHNIRFAMTRATRAVIEFLEERRLLSAAAQISDTTSANVANAVAFNTVATGNSGAGPSRIETVTITDIGGSALTFGSGAFAIVNDPSTTANASDFKIVNSGSLPSSLAPGASATVQLQYTATAVGLQSALLQINSNDTVTPTLTINLHGIGTAGQFGVLEPSLVQVLRAHNIPTIVGAGVNDANINTQKYPVNPDPSSEEVAMQRLVVATAGQPVTITPIASFSSATAAVSRIGYYTPGDPTDATELFTIGKADAQIVDPTALGATSFDPGSKPFGLYGTFPGTTTPDGSLDVHYSEDSLNVLDPTHERKVRFFPMKTSSGAVVPNTFVFAIEDYNDPTTYNSFINFVGIISNVKAAPNATAGSTPSSTTANNPPVMGVVESQPAAGSDNLVFNTIQKTNLISPDIVHNTNTVTINNTGNQPLVINSLSLSDTKNWKLVNPPAAGTSIAGGASLTVTIQFIATSSPPHSTDETNDIKSDSLVSVQAAGGVWTGTLTINSNDSINPTKTINLAGYWQIETEHENEPGISTLTNLLFGYTTNDTGSTATQGTELTNSGNTPILYGSEVDPSTDQGLLVAADPSQPVSLIEGAAFHQQYVTTTATVGASTVSLESASESGTTATLTSTGPHGFKVGQQVTVTGESVSGYNGTFTITAVPSSTTFSYTAASGLAAAMTQPTAPQSGWYPVGSSSTHKLYKDQPNNGQSVLPLSDPDSYSTVMTTFTPTGAFGLNLDGEKSQDSLNAAVDMPFNTSGHAIRFFPALDASGNPIPNTWIVGMDYRNYAGPNSDYQDLFMILTNATFEATPAAPIDLHASEATTGVNLQWAPVTGATSYNVYQVVNGTQVKVNANPVTGASYVDLTAPAGTTQYHVTAVNGSGESLASSASVTLAGTGPSVPTAPAIQQADGSSGTHVALSWTSVFGATSYSVSREGPGATVFTTIASGLTATSYSDTSVTAGATYQYEVQAQNTAGASPASAPVGATVMPTLVAPGTPTLQSADGSSGIEVALAWNPVAGATTYNVYREDPGQTTFTQIAGGLTTGAYDDTAVTQGATYSYSIQAQNTAGESALSPPLSATVATSSPTLMPPANLLGDGSAGTQVSLTWDLVDGATSYNVAREGPGDTAFVQIASGLTVGSLADTSVTEGDSYQYAVQSVNAGGPSALSAAITVAVAVIPVTINPPTNLQADASSGTDVVLTWSAPAGAIAYNVLRQAPGSSAFVTAATGLTSATYTDTSVVAGSTYLYEVQATNGSATSVASAPVSAAIPAAPGPTLDVTVGKGADKSVQFTDANGTLTTIRMTGTGTAKVHFTAASISQSVLKGVATVSGSNVALASIATTGTTAGSGLLITTKGGNGTVSVGGISIDAALNHITAKTATLVGALSTAAGISAISLGSANGATINIGGALQNFKIATATAVTLTAGGVIRNLQAGSWNSSGLISAPSINSINILGDATLNVGAAVLHTLRVRGTLSQSQLTLTGAGTSDLAMLSAGAISGTVIDATGNLAMISAGSISSSKIYAGVASTGALPSSAADFSASSIILGVTIKGKGTFSDTAVAARQIKNLKLGAVQFANGGAPFGAAASSIASLTLTDASTNKAVRLHNVTGSAAVTAVFAQDAIVPQDFVVDIV
ncbi:MAG TPA: hypothetical protein VG326_04890 [Tepidisphaeraceae bacterium]|nr:hypothetical protein [Tepidisphaeraceae bacterium]